MAAVMNNDINYTDKISFYKHEVNELGIGFQIGSGIGAEIHLNPDKYRTRPLNPTDKLIVLSQQLYT